MTDLLEWLGYPYATMKDRWIIVRDRTGKEYKGVLYAWGPHYITVRNDTEDMLINRNENNIVSIRIMDSNPDRRA